MNDLPLTLLDHAFVVIVLLVLFPFAGWWSYQQYTTKGAQTGERALVREYQITIFWLLCLLGATLAVWGINGRPIQGLYVNWNLTEYRALAIGGCIAIGFVVLLRPILVAFNKGMALQMALAYQPLSDFLPRTPRELVWGLLVSVAAGTETRGKTSTQRKYVRLQLLVRCHSGYCVASCRDFGSHWLGRG